MNMNRVISENQPLEGSSSPSRNKIDKLVSSIHCLEKIRKSLCAGMIGGLFKLGHARSVAGLFEY